MRPHRPGQHRPELLTILMLIVLFAAGSSAVLAARGYRSASAPPQPVMGSGRGHAQGSGGLGGGRTTGAVAVRPAAGNRHDHDHDYVVFIGGFPYDPLYWDAAYPFGLYWGWYDPWWYGPPASGYAYMMAVPAGMVPVALHVHPWKATLTVDGSNLGQARDFNSSSHPLWLKSGGHKIVLVYPGYQSLEFNLDVGKALAYDLHYRLTKTEVPKPGV
jgi:hypothetical protein